VAAAAHALRQAQEFISDVSGPPDSKAEELRLTSTLHALDHASRLAKIAQEEPEFAKMNGGSEDVRAAQLCAEAMQKAASVVGDIARESALSASAAPIKSLETLNATSALAKLEQCAKALRELRQAHRATTLSAIGSGELAADQAMDRVETVRQLEALTHHAWRSAAHLVGRGEEPGRNPVGG
jgi:phosphate:Na+ symporter